MVKKCKRCGKNKEYSDFYGKEWKICKQCVKKQGAKRRKTMHAAAIGLFVKHHISDAVWGDKIYGPHKDKSPFVDKRGGMYLPQQCSVCRETKNLLYDFYTSSTTHTGYETTCSECRYDRMKGRDKDGTGNIRHGR